MTQNILYSDDDIYGRGRPSKYSGGTANPNSQYLKHFDNALLLTRLIQVSKNLPEVYRAKKELETAERKMKHWSTRPNFGQELIQTECLKRKQLWATSP